MSDVVISVEQVSKLYRLGKLQNSDYRTMRDHLGAALKAPFRMVGRAFRRGGSAEPAGAENELWALRDLSFEIRRGEAVALIGSNGAGKSTILKILSRITAPTHGRIEITGRVGSLLEVGTGFHPELTGRENIFLNGSLLGMTRQEIQLKFDEIVAFAEVEKFIDTPVKFYSSGMYVRLAFAVAAHLEPEILIVDEVLAVGDARFQRKCIGKMGDVAREGRTVIFVSHNMATIANLCRKAVLLRHGRKVSEGPTDQIISQYLNSIADSSKSALALRTDRKGSGEMRITDIQYFDAQGNLTQYPICGEPLTVRVFYQGRSERRFQNCTITLSLNRNERPLFLLSTDMVDTRQIDLQGSGYIDFRVPSLPLTEGNYYFILWLFTNGELQDFVDHAMEMSVVGGDFFGTSRSCPIGWEGQIVLVHHSWDGPRELAVGDAAPVDGAMVSR